MELYKCQLMSPQTGAKVTFVNILLSVCDADAVEDESGDAISFREVQRPISPCISAGVNVIDGQI